eukprot:5613562-Pyramimonas_sp.AAC.1
MDSFLSCPPSSWARGAHPVQVVRGVKGAMKNSQHYPDEFGHAARQLFERHWPAVKKDAFQEKRGAD